jgi:hypothetical protein
MSISGVRQPSCRRYGNLSPGATRPGGSPAPATTNRSVVGLRHFGSGKPSKQRGPSEMNERLYHRPAGLALIVGCKAGVSRTAGSWAPALQNVGAPGSAGIYSRRRAGVLRPRSARSLHLEVRDNSAKAYVLAELGSSNAGPLRRVRPPRRSELRNVGAPTKIRPVAQTFRPEGFPRPGAPAIDCKFLTPKGASYRVAA